MNNLTIKNNERDFMFVKCSDMTYLIDTNNVVEIIKIPRLEYPQRLPKYISGLLDYQGQIINTIDLKNVLGLEVKTYNKDTTIIIVEAPGGQLRFALALDGVDKVDKININEIKPTYSDASSNFTKGIYVNGEKSFAVLDVYKIIHCAQNAVKNNELSDMPNILPSFDLEIYNKRSLKYKNQKSEMNSILISKNNQYITFKVSGTDYCIHNSFIKTFYKLNQEKITRIPSSKNFIVGILNVKGEYITIIDINSFFEREKAEISSKSTIIIPDSGEFKIGFLADEVGGTINIDNVEELSGNITSYIMNEKIYYILNLQNILNDEKLYLR